MVRTQRQTGCTFFIAACCHDHRGAPRTCNLDGSHAYAAAAALHQQGLTALQATTVENIAPDREKRFRQRSRLHVAQTLWHRQALRNRRCAPLCVAAAAQQSTHPVAHLQARLRHGSCITTFHHSGHLQPWKVRGARRRCVVALALHHVRPIDAAGGHPNQYFTHTRHWHGTVAQVKHLWPPKSGDFYCMHGYRLQSVLFE